MARKFLLLIGVCCAMAVLLLAVGATGLASVSGRADDISRHNLSSAALLTSINAAALRVQADVGSVAIASGPVALKVFQDRINATDAEMDRLIEEYRRTAMTGRQHEALLRFTVWWQAYRNYREHRLMVLATTDPAAFQTCYLGQSQLITDRAMSALDTLLVEEQAEGMKAARAARSTYRQALAMMIVTMVVGLGFALLLARRLTRLIVHPVYRVADVLSAVAQGDLSQEAHVAQRDELGHMASALSVATNSMREGVEALRAQKEMLRQLTLSDQLTGLPNRTYFLERLGSALGQMRRQPGYRFAMLLLDLDGFKLVNDSLGHLLGDKLLVQAAERIKSSVRQHDVAARFGGDEFAILIDGIEEDNNPEMVARRLQTALCVPFTLSEHTVVVSVSIGIALSDTGYADSEDVIRDADIAMYSAKSQGKGTHAIFGSAMRAQVVDRMQTEAQLRQALERDELEVYYQPIVDLNTQMPIGCEALIRWRHPDHGLIQPDMFLSVAEDSGLIVPVGRWLLTEACRQTQQWCLMCGRDIQISVNVSNRQFWHSDLLADLDTCLRETGLPPRCLVVEVTESVIMHDVTVAQKILDSLQELGVRLHIDDFGTGYSSLEALHHLSIDALKIDKSFVSSLGVDRRGDELTRTIIVMGTNLGLDLIAEGIENSYQCDLLRDLGCGYGQGLWFSPPIAVEKITNFFRQRWEIPMSLPMAD